MAAAGPAEETNDSVTDNAGGDADRVYLGPGDDFVDVRDGDDDDFIDCGPGSDRFAELDPGDEQGPGCEIE